MKKIIALLSALTMITAFVGCGSEGGSSSETTEAITIAETTKATTQTIVDKTESSTEAIAIELDKIENIEEMSLLTCSDWMYRKNHDYNYWYQNDGGYMMLFTHDLENDVDLSTYSEEEQSKFQEEFFKSAYESFNSSNNMKNPTEIENIIIDKKPAITFNCEAYDMYVNNFIVLFNNKSYSIAIVEKRNGKETTISKYADQIIESIKFSDSTQSQNITTTSNGLQAMTIDSIEKLAKDDASTATAKDIEKCIKTLESLKGHFFDSESNMEKVMYNALMIKHYYSDSKTTYKQVGEYAFKCVELVYTGLYDKTHSKVCTTYTDFVHALDECPPLSEEETIVSTEPPTEKITTYSAGTYKVGIDIPAGEYCIYCTSSISGYYSVNADSKGDSIIGNDNFDYNAFVTVSDGQYLELSRATAVPVSAIDGVSYKIDTSKTGTFRVGIDIPAGEYKLINDSKLSGYYCVYNNSNPDADIVTNDNFEGQTYITVSDGQYLLLSRCKIEQ
jgi:hypothetical protein